MSQLGNFSGSQLANFLGSQMANRGGGGQVVRAVITSVTSAGFGSTFTIPDQTAIHWRLANGNWQANLAMNPGSPPGYASFMYWLPNTAFTHMESTDGSTIYYGNVYGLDTSLWLPIAQGGERVPPVGFVFTHRRSISSSWGIFTVTGYIYQ